MRVMKSALRGRSGSPRSPECTSVSCFGDVDSTARPVCGMYAYDLDGLTIQIHRSQASAATADYLSTAAYGPWRPLKYQLRGTPVRRFRIFEEFADRHSGRVMSRVPCRPG